MVLRLSFITFLLASLLSTALYAGEQSVYDFSWLDKDKEVFVLQNRKFRKAGKPFVNIGSGITTSGAFVDSYYFQGRAGFFVSEEWGLEVLYSKNTGTENESAKSVRNLGGAGSTPFRRIVDNYYGAALLWSPFYGKINTFNSIVYFDWIIGAGFGQLTESNNKATIIEGTPMADETNTHNAVFWETALKFWINKTWSVQADLTAFYYEAEKAQTIDSSNANAYYSNYDLGLSLGMSF